MEIDNKATDRIYLNRLCVERFQYFVATIFGKAAFRLKFSNNFKLAFG